MDQLKAFMATDLFVVKGVHVTVGVVVIALVAFVVYRKYIAR